MAIGEPSGDPVTVNGLDVGNPLHVQNSDNSNHVIIPFMLLCTENYRTWSGVVKLALQARNKYGFVDGTCLKESYATSDVLSAQWDRCGSSVANYYHILNSLWREFDALAKLPKCTCDVKCSCDASKELGLHQQLMKLMQFLMGMDDCYHHFRSSIFTRDPLPGVKDAYNVVSREESHRGVPESSGVTESKQNATSFVAKTFNNNRRQFNDNNNFTRGSTRNVNRGPNPSINCINCGKVGHTIDRCFKIVGFPPSFKRNANAAKQGFSANFESQINDTSTRSIHANMEGANQHLIVSTVRMFNVVDITSLNITVGHPNGTLATIIHVGNLKLSNNVILYNVLVVPGLKRETVLGTGSESGGLYLLGHPVDQVMSALHNDLKISKPSSVPGPYRVPSREGYKYFLTIVDDYSIAIWVYLVKIKDEVFDVFVSFISLISNQFNAKVKTVRSYNGTEFVNSKIYKLFSELGIIHQTYCAHTPQQNRIAERKHGHLFNVARSFKFHGGIPLRFWSDYFLTAVYFIKGYSSVKNAYKLLSLDIRNVFFSKDVRFYETIFPFKMKSNSSVDVEYSSETDLINFFDNQTSQRPYDDGRTTSTMDGSVSSSRHDTDTIVDMDHDSAHIVAAFKVSMLKLGEFELWRMRIEQYIWMIDYALWEVIENGATLPKTQVMEGVTTVMPITSAEDKAQRRLEVKARSTLMMEKADLDTMSIDDLYNNLKVYEPEVKRISSSSSSTQNMAFVSSSNNNTSSSNKAVNAAHGVTIASTQVNIAYSTNIDNLSDVVICLESVEEKLEFYKKNESVYVENINGLKWDIQVGEITIRELRKKLDKIQKEKDSIQFNVDKFENASKSLNNLMECQIVDNCKKDEFGNKPVVESRKSDKEVSKVVRKSDDSLIIKDWVSDNEEENVSQTKTEKKIVNIVKKDFDKSKQQQKLLGKLLNKQVNDAHSKTTVNAARPMSYLSKAAHSTVKRPIHKNTSFKNINIDQRVNTVSDYEEIDGGYVAFGGNPKGGKITRKARTPQQNGVAGRRNRILIKAARTMLADSKLPTTFWAEAVNTACYVQNRVLVVKPHNKTLYELFHGRTPTLSFMRPFGCPVTILNTIDHLGKFDGKADEGFFVGYSLNSKAFRVFNSRTRIVEENLHIRFCENTPNVVGSGPDWLFVIDVQKQVIMHVIKETKPVKDYILLPLWTADPPYSQDPKSSHDDGSKPSSDDGKKVNEDPRKDNECNDQEKEDNVNSTNTVNVAGTNEVNVVGGKTSIELPFDPNMPALEDDSIFDFTRDDEDDGVVADMNNLDTTIQVSPIPTTRIHKDHPLDQVIRDLQSATQTRKMSKNLKEHGFVSTIQQRTNLKKLQMLVATVFYH
ncbi:putative ribonuclease H-like domain-containing protein [Tanacetum coccineum]